MTRLAKRYLTKDELAVIRGALLVYKSRIRSDISNTFDNKLVKYEKLTPYEYDEAIRLLQTSEKLYKELGLDDTDVIIAENGQLERVSE